MNSCLIRIATYEGLQNEAKRLTESVDMQLYYSLFKTIEPESQRQERIPAHTTQPFTTVSTPTHTHYRL